MVWLFGGTILLSSFLLFLVQPMFAKMALPPLGGTPAVWNTCMMFFQGALLAGYCYAHAGPRWLGAGRHGALHAALMFGPALALPLGIPGWLGEPGSGGSPTLWLLAALGAGVGLPFFALSTTNPLLQSWFSRSGHRLSGDPYFLYSASNAGSLLALAAYPTLVEPNLGLGAQAAAWSAGYGILALLIGCCLLAARRGASRAGISDWRGRGVGSESESGSGSGSGGDSERIGWRRAGRWVVLAAIPSSLTLGLTTHVTTDVASAPLLWVVPLGVYLLSLIIPFSRRPLIPHVWACRLTPIAALSLAVATTMSGTLRTWTLGLHLAALGLASLTCHGELARDRPSARHLTSFYLWMALGGALGGTFNTLAAPALFPGIWEYPLALGAALWVWPGWGGGASGVSGVSGSRGGAWSRGWRGLAVDAAFAGCVGVWVYQGYYRGAYGWFNEWAAGFAEAGRISWRTHAALVWWCAVAALGAGALACLAVSGVPRRMAAGMLAVWFTFIVCSRAEENTLYSHRGFYGLLRVYERDGRHYLVHGTTWHGMQIREEGRQCESVSYFHPEGPLGQALRAPGAGSSNRTVAVLGLGIGAIANYARDDRDFVYFELDPEVKRVAEDPGLFTYLSKCSGGRYRIVLGDGRLGIGREADGAFGTIVFDAFGSDAIPTHLITVEAARTYLEKLDEGGLLIFNITNRYVDLAPVMGKLAEELGLECRLREDVGIDSRKEPDRFASRYAVMARRLEDLGPLGEDERWVRIEVPEGMRAWTDDYTNLVSLIQIR